MKRRIGVAVGVAVGVALALVLASSSVSAGDRPTGDLDVMFIGAHPDDEASGLSTYGQWNEYEGIETGVITITRGEGGGNAVGPEEGAELGLLREDEERRAVGKAGIENIYNLDEVDFYYTVSSPLTGEIWDHDDTLEKVVRVLRHTKPEVIVTMDPAPSPGNHGNHQYAGRLAVEAYREAANPEAFPEQIIEEGLETWRPSRIFQNSADGEPLTGESCAASFEPEEATDTVFGVWGGRASERNDGALWEQVEREAQQLYVSQGWAAFPDASEDPSEAACDYFTQIDSRVPFDADDTSPTAMLRGAVLPSDGDLPLGTEFYLTSDASDITAGETLTVTAHAKSGSGDLPDSSVVLDLPEGWEARGDGGLGTLTQDDESETTFEVTPPPDAGTDTKYRVGATLTSGEMTGETGEVVEIVPDVSAAPEALPQVEEYRNWTREASVPQLSDAVLPVIPVGSGGSREVRVDLTNRSDEPRSGSVELSLPDGFTARPETREYEDLAPGSSESVTFKVTNEDASLPAGLAGGEEGDYAFEIATTTDDGGRSALEAAFNVVPTTGIADSPEAPVVDGVEEEGEYAGESLDISNFWEGEEPDSEEDASGEAKVAWSGDALYLLIGVTDDEFGTVLEPRDAKRHWRTDSVEIAVDPTGDSENTSTTFKVGVFPETDDPANGDPPAAYRDADAYQGPTDETAPGMEVASTVGDPYDGYTLEAKIPFDALPAPVNPEELGLDVLIYDSDTQDKTGQTRLGWSAWPGVQGDPYRWGDATLEAYGEAGSEARQQEPVIPTEAASSEASFQSVVQSARDGVPLSGASPVSDPVSVSLVSEDRDNRVTLGLSSPESGEASVFIRDGGEVIGSESVTLVAGEERVLNVPVEGNASDAEALVGFRTEDGRVSTSSMPLSLAQTGGAGVRDLWEMFRDLLGSE